MYAICEHTATWRQKFDAESSHYRCDLCYMLHFRGQPNWEEAPHAEAVRIFNQATTDTRMLSGCMVESLKKASTILLQALPPCQLPPSYEQACLRCIWAAGLEPNQSYRARRALKELTEQMNELRPGAWEMSLAHETALTAAGYDILADVLSKVGAES